MPVLPGWELAIAGLLAGISFIFTYDIIKRDIMPVIIASIVVTLIWIWGKEFYGPVYGTGLAAMLGAIIANLYSRISHSSNLIIKIPTAIITVPGIFGFRALSEIIINGANSGGIDHLLTTFALGAAIAGGFLFADIIIPPASNLKRIKGS